MIRCEHFVYGLDPRNGIKLHKSPAIDRLLSDKNFLFLRDIGEGATEDTLIQVWLDSDNILAVSRVHPVTDEYGRSGTWNHTIIIDMKDYLKLTQPQTLFAPYLITSMKGVGTWLHGGKLEPIEIKET